MGRTWDKEPDDDNGRAASMLVRYAAALCPGLYVGGSGLGNRPLNLAGLSLSRYEQVSVLRPLRAAYAQLR